jgi:anaerobic ribonucleoside-triphosphate reductase
MAPIIRYDNLDYVDVKQAVQEFIFNLNVPTRVGFQTPFINVYNGCQADAVNDGGKYYYRRQNNA